MATALYDFTSGETEDLSFSEGDRILILEHGELLFLLLYSDDFSGGEMTLINVLSTCSE